MQAGPVATQTLYDSDTLHVTCRRGHRSSRVVVTFDPLIDPAIPRFNWGEDFLAACGFDQVHIAARSNAWYQYQDMPAALAAARTVTREYREVAAYGLSMGAYAAINFSQDLGADLVVAISPQYSVDIAKVPFERLYDHLTHGLRFPCDYIDRITAPPARTYVIYDPEHLDRHHVALIERTVPITPIRIPFGGHGCLMLLIELGCFAELIRNLLHGTADLDAVRRLVAEKSPAMASYHDNRARTLPPRQRRRALQEARQAVALAPDSPWIANTLLDLLLRSGGHDEAAVLIHSHLEHWTDPNRRCFHAGIRHYLLGDHQQALDRFAELRHRWATSPSLSLAASLALERLGRHREAVEAGQAAARLRPRDAALRRYLLWLRLPRGLRDLAVRHHLTSRWFVPDAAECLYLV